MEELELRAAKIKEGLQLLAPISEKVQKAIAAVAEGLDLHPCDIDMVYHSDMLEYSIAVANCMGVEVDLDGFFETMKEATRYKTKQLLLKYTERNMEGE